MQAFFARIKAHSNVKYVYTERKIDDANIQYILDAEPLGTSDHSPPGTTDSNDLDKERVYAHHIPTSYAPKSFTRWGRLLGAYAPIFDRQGELLGVAGIDIDASLLSAQLNKLQAILVTLYAAIIVIALVFMVRSSNTIVRSMLEDKLTGAYAKRYSEQLIHDEMAAAVKGHKDLALLMLDLDRFKEINDTYGHCFGDHVLSSVSHIIKKSLRQEDYFIRYGGEEFIVVIPDADAQCSVEIAERIRQAVAESEILHTDDECVKMTISIGVAHLDNFAMNVKDFIDCADKALYAAKKSRNCVALFEPDNLPSKNWMNKRSTDRISEPQM
jgi:diguanylate cyclase (GGDEF)-like protein